MFLQRVSSRKVIELDKKFSTAPFLHEMRFVLERTVKESETQFTLTAAVKDESLSLF